MVAKKILRKNIRQIIVCVLTFCLFFNTSLPIVLAEPVNPVVAEGSAVFQQSGNTTTITTTTSQTIIKYDSFDVLHNEIANFVQPNSSSNVMNRINAARPTALDGTIMSNGGVYWLNPAGVIIGGGAVINVTKLVASALDMSNSDFMAGIDRFAGGQGAVINKGNINAQSVYLVAKQVLNTGRIISPKGHVVITAGDRVFISEPGSNIIVEIDSTAVGPDGGFSNLPLPDMANVTNEGTVEATGGKIILAAAGDAISSPMMANLGTLSTSVEEGDAGNISLRAVNGQIENSGSITAGSGSGTGGTVTAEGARVGNFGTINVDSAEGNGGSINLTADEVVVLGHESLTTANAGTNGDGGEIITYSHGMALFRNGAVIEAKGGTESGDGGFVEVSGNQYVEIFGDVDTSAPAGQAGSFLIDPYDIDIVAGTGWNEGSWNGDPVPGDGDTWASDSGSDSYLGVDSLLQYLEHNNILIYAGYSSSEDNITVSAPINYSDTAEKTYNDLTLSAEDHMIVNADITTGTHDLTLTANNNDGSLGDVEINAAISQTSGNFEASGNNFTSNVDGTITSGSGNASIVVEENITTNAPINLNGGHLVMLGGRVGDNSTVQINSGITADSIIIEAGDPLIGNNGTVNLNVGNGVTLTATMGDLTASARKHVTIGGDVQAEQGSVYLTGDSDNLGVGHLSTKSISADENIELAGKDITVGGDIVALKDDITLHNSTNMTKSGAKIQAGHDIILTDECDTLTGTGQLTLDAKNGQINQGSTTITVSGSDLIYKQFADLDMTGRSFGNKGITEVTLQSYNGYVKDEAANEWASITATANNGVRNDGYAILLSGDSGDIIAKELLAEDDNIKITTTTSGDVIVDDITAANDKITIVSAGSIEENPDADADLTAAELDLEAVSGIGTLAERIETDTAKLTAEVTAAGDIYITEADGVELVDVDVTEGTLDIETVAAGLVTATAVDNAKGPVKIDSAGSLTATHVFATDGSVDLDAAGALIATDVRAIEDAVAGDYDVSIGTTAGGNVTVDDVRADNKITIVSAGSIEENPDADADLTAATLDIDAATGIGTSDPLETDVSSLTAYSAAGDIAIVEKDDVDLHDVLADNGSIYLEATDGGMAYSSGTIKAGSSTLTMIQSSDLDISIFNFDNQTNTDLMLQSTSGSVTADTTNANNSADKWKSIQAIAKDNIELQGEGDIKIGTHEGFDTASHTFGGVVKSDSGGVSIISDNAGVSTFGDTILDNIDITGSSNGTSGVDLPYGVGKAAIVIMSEETLTLGSGVELTANGMYDTTDTVDDRAEIDFLDHDIPADSKLGGWPIDVAIYLASNGGDVHVGSPVADLPDGAAVVADAYDTVTFGTVFETSLEDGNVDWLEVCSRISGTLGDAWNSGSPRLPYVTDSGLGSLTWSGSYVLRGENPDVGTGAWIFEEEEDTPNLLMRDVAQASSTETPSSPELGEVGQIEGMSIDNLTWLAEELELCQGDEEGEDRSRCQEIAQAYLAGAFLQATDLKPYQAATRLRDLVEILHDADGSRVAALIQVINEFSQPDAPPSPEQFASIAQAFEAHTNDGTHYATAKEWLNTLTEYVTILNTEIGWQPEESIAFVMGKYGTAITESGDIGVMAFVQMQLEGFGS